MKKIFWLSLSVLVIGLTIALVSTKTGPETETVDEIDFDQQ